MKLSRWLVFGFIILAVLLCSGLGSADRITAFTLNPQKLDFGAQGEFLGILGWGAYSGQSSMTAQALCGAFIFFPKYYWAHEKSLYYRAYDYSGKLLSSGNVIKYYPGSIFAAGFYPCWCGNFIRFWEVMSYDGKYIELWEEEVNFLGVTVRGPHQVYEIPVSEYHYPGEVLDASYDDMDDDEENYDSASPAANADELRTMGGYMNFYTNEAKYVGWSGWAGFFLRQDHDGNKVEEAKLVPQKGKYYTVSSSYFTHLGAYLETTQYIPQKDSKYPLYGPNTLLFYPNPWMSSGLSSVENDSQTKTIQPVKIATSNDKVYSAFRKMQVIQGGTGGNTNYLFYQFWQPNPWKAGMLDWYIVTYMMYQLDATGRAQGNPFEITSPKWQHKLKPDVKKNVSRYMDSISDLVATGDGRYLLLQARSLNRKSGVGLTSAKLKDTEVEVNVLRLDPAKKEMTTVATMNVKVAEKDYVINPVAMSSAGYMFFYYEHFVNKTNTLTPYFASAPLSQFLN